MAHIVCAGAPARRPGPADEDEARRMELRLHAEAAGWRPRVRARHDDVRAARLGKPHPRTTGARKAGAVRAVVADLADLAVVARTAGAAAIHVGLVTVLGAVAAARGEDVD